MQTLLLREFDLVFSLYLFTPFSLRFIGNDYVPFFLSSRAIIFQRWHSFRLALNEEQGRRFVGNVPKRKLRNIYETTRIILVFDERCVILKNSMLFNECLFKRKSLLFPNAKSNYGNKLSNYSMFFFSFSLFSHQLQPTKRYSICQIRHL